jgi:hypothetical protein
MVRASKYAFLLQQAGLWPLKGANGEAMMAMNLALLSECFKGDRPPHCKKNIRLLRALFPGNLMIMYLTLELVCGDRGPFLAAAAMVMGGVVGRWPWCLRQHKPYK